MRAFLAVACFVAACGVSSLRAQAPVSPPAEHGVVGTAWLADHARDADLVLVHVVHDSAYRGDQIPGSRQVWYNAFVTRRGTVGSELPAVEQLRAVFERLGIGNGSRVVVYAPEAPMATRFLFTLDYMGHQRIAFLDGGLPAWKREVREIALQADVPARSEYTPHVRAGIVATADFVSARVDKPGLSLIDTRTTAEFIGEGIRGGLPSEGHLAGARQLEWEQLFSDAEHTMLKPRAELQRLFAERVQRGDQVVSYCWVGYRASATYFIARHLGYEARLYDGSYQDWAQRSLPVRKGMSP